MAASTGKPSTDPRRRLALSNHRFLTKCYNTLRDLDAPSISASEAQAYHIIISDLDWHADKIIDLEPRFCTPFPEDELERLHRELLDSPPEAEPDEDMPTRRGGFQNSKDLMLHLWGWIRRGHRGQKSLGSFGDWTSDGLRDARDGYQPLNSYIARGRGQVAQRSSIWELELIFKALPWPQDPWPVDEEQERKHISSSVWHSRLAQEPHLRRRGQKPLVHLAAALTNDGPSDNTKLLRSEVMSAVSLMGDQMRQPQNWDYAKFPVFLYSFSDFDVRVLQFHLEARERKIFVRKTPYMRIDDMSQHDKIKLILRWMMNKPIGDLELDLNDVGLMDEGTTSVRQLPPTPRKSRVKCT